MDFEDCFFDTEKYTLTNTKLGEGTFGKVYVVERIDDESQFAAKIISPFGMINSHDQMMFLRESFILRKLDHPALVKFFGINFHSFDDPTKLEPTILTEYYSKDL